MGEGGEMMRSLTTKEFCARPDLLLAEGDLVLTADGAATAIVIGLHDEEDAAELERLIRRARSPANPAADTLQTRHRSPRRRTSCRCSPGFQPGLTPGRKRPGPARHIACPAPWS